MNHPQKIELQTLTIGRSIFYGKIFNDEGLLHSRQRKNILSNSNIMW